MSAKVFGVERHSEEWYELEYSHPQQNDWYSSSHHADTEANIRADLQKVRLNTPDFDFRIVRKTLTTEVAE